MKPQTRLKIMAMFCAVTGSGQPLAAQADAFIGQALDLVNEARQDEGLQSLETNADLTEAALAHAEDMLERDFFAHDTPEGEAVQDRYLAAGGNEWELVAENLAYCGGCPAPDAERIRALQEGWMNSPGHRANILREGLSHFGFAVVGGEGRDLYAVQTFSGPGTSRGSDSGRADPADASVAALERVNIARREASVPELAASASLGAAAERLVPEDLSGFTLDGMGDLQGALPPEDQGDWMSIASLAGVCGGCGASVTVGDAEGFVDDWLEQPGYRGQLLDPAMTHFGFVLRADGAGRKVALGLSGEER